MDGPKRRRITIYNPDMEQYLSGNWTDPFAASRAEVARAGEEVQTDPVFADAALEFAREEEEEAGWASRAMPVWHIEGLPSRWIRRLGWGLRLLRWFGVDSRSSVTLPYL
jgi:hypothetical protein